MKRVEAKAMDKKTMEKYLHSLRLPKRAGNQWAMYTTLDRETPSKFVSLGKKTSVKLHICSV